MLKFFEVVDQCNIALCAYNSSTLINTWPQQKC